jgi:hypothetical protein
VNDLAACFVIGAVAGALSMLIFNYTWKDIEK